MSDLFGPVTPFLLMALITGLVEFAKQVVERGALAWPQITALALGILFGGVYVVVYPTGAVDARAVFEAVVYGGLLGLASTGLYDISKRLAGRNVKDG